MIPRVTSVARVNRTGPRQGGGLVPLLPGLVHHYRYPSASGWADRVGGADGVHTGSPSLASGGPRWAPNGVEYDGATQYTEVAGVEALAFIHQTWVFSVHCVFVWHGAGSNSGDGIAGNTVSSADRGWALLAEDRVVGGGPAALRAFTARGQSGVSNTVAGGTLVNGQRHHALLTADGSDLTLRLDGSVVGTGALIATATGDASKPLRIGDVHFSLPFDGLIYDVAIGNQDWSDYAADLAAEALA